MDEGSNMGTTTNAPHRDLKEVHLNADLRRPLLATVPH